MPRGVPSSTYKCCTCNGQAAKCKNCKCARAKHPCTNCSAAHCLNKLENPADITNINTNHCNDGHRNNTFNNEPVHPIQPVHNDDIQCEASISHQNSVSPEYIDVIFTEVALWKPNLLRLPRCQASKSFISEMARIYEFAASDSCSLKLAIILPQLVLQRCRNSKMKQTKELIQRRMESWQTGNYGALLGEARYLQYQNSKRNKIDNIEDDWRRSFRKLVLNGRLTTAVRLLDLEPGVGIPLDIDDAIEDKTVRQLLLDKHPEPALLDEDAILSSPLKNDAVFHPIAFDSIDADSIITAACRMSGGAGPSGLDAKAWIAMLSTFGTESRNLADALALFSKHLSTCKIPKTSMEAFTTSRLIPLSKLHGIRPIGIGDVSRRIISKAILKVVQPQLQHACGSIQCCASHRAGTECVIHALKTHLSNENNILLTIDADNAFNRINRKLALRNMPYICPALSVVLSNLYRDPTRMATGNEYIWSSEGFTQGDVFSMAAFSAATLPLIYRLIKKCPNVEQLWYADDGNMVGPPSMVKAAFKMLMLLGPKYGFYINPEKCKIYSNGYDSTSLQTEFSDTSIPIMENGVKILGSPIGKYAYVKQFVSSFVQDISNSIERLVDMGELDVQVAYTAFIRSIQHKWSHLLRTCACSVDWIGPLSERIKMMISKLFNIDLSSDEFIWRTLCLSYRDGGVSIRDPSALVQSEYESSTSLCAPCLEGYSGESLKGKQDTIIKLIRAQNISRCKINRNNILDNCNHLLRRSIEHSSVKGASSWLSVYPSHERNSRLSNDEFRDAMAARYGFLPKSAPSYCQCGTVNSLAHSLSCSLGGLPSMRHDVIRDFLAYTLTEICPSVQIEPRLAPVSSNVTFLKQTTTKDKEARLDISCNGLFGDKTERTLIDVCIFNALAPSNLSRNPSACFEYHESRKRNKYLERITEIERASFIPVVLSNSGGAGKGTESLLKKIANTIAERAEVKYSDVISTLRCRIGIRLARMVSRCIRGSRSAFHRPVFA